MKRMLLPRRGRTALAMLSGVAIISACSGENLFSLAGTAGTLGPDVEITAPPDGEESLPGDSVLVQATVSAPDGAANAVYRSHYAGSEVPAFTSETQSLNGVSVVSLSNYLRAAPGQTEGTAYVVVEVTDRAGAVGADSVSVTIPLLN